MTGQREIESVLDSWLGDGHDAMPDRSINAILDAVQQTPQRVVQRIRWRHTETSPALRFALAGTAAVVVVLVAGLVLALLGGVRAPIAGQPSPSSTAGARGPNVVLVPDQTLRDRWESSPEPLFSVVTDDGRGYRWRGATYDYFDGQAWQQVVDRTVSVPAFENLQNAAQTQDAGLSVGRHDVSSAVTSTGFTGRTIVAPGDAFQLDRPASVQTNSVGGLLRIDLDSDMEPGSSYTVVARVFWGPDLGSGLTAADLAGAGVNYGPAFKPYVEVQPNSIGPVTQATAQEIVNALPPSQRDPYHVAIAVRDYLLTNFGYTNDITGLCTGQNRVDCFLTVKKGFCEGFATAMAMILRTQQIPTRYVTGFLPGQAEDFVVTEGEDIGEVVTRRVVTRSASHAWVEVYFPGFGWYPFDPTPGLDTGQGPTASPLATPSPASSVP